MNLVVLHRGEGLFVPAGVLHAYQSGLGVEIMAASDNVLRGGLTPKHVDVGELMRVLDPTPGPVPVLRPAERDGVRAVRAGRAGLRAHRGSSVAPGEQRDLELDGTAIALRDRRRGDRRRRAHAAEARLAPGRAACVTPDEAAVVITGEGELFVAPAGSATRRRRVVNVQARGEALRSAT